MHVFTSLSLLSILRDTSKLRLRRKKASPRGKVELSTKVEQK